MKPAEYVEKIVAELFKREADQEENVVRILPFFATALGVVATMLIFVRPALCPPSLQPMTIAIYGVLLATVVVVFVVLGFLIVSVWPRRFQVPMTEEALLGYAEELTNYYTAPGPETPAAGTIEDAIVDDLREAMTKQMAIAATRSRAINSTRLGARSRAVTALVFAISLAFSLVALILVRDTLFPGACNAGHQSTSSIPSGTHPLRSNGANGSEAEPPGNARNDQGRLDLQGGSPADGPAAGATVTSEHAKPANPSTPAAAPAVAPKPAPPPMETPHQRRRAGRPQEIAHADRLSCARWPPEKPTTHLDRAAHAPNRRPRRWIPGRAYRGLGCERVGPKKRPSNARRRRRGSNVESTSSSSPPSGEPTSSSVRPEPASLAGFSLANGHARAHAQSSPCGAIGPPGYRPPGGGRPIAPWRVLSRSPGGVRPGVAALAAMGHDREHPARGGREQNQACSVSHPCCVEQKGTRGKARKSAVFCRKPMRHVLRARTSCDVQESPDLRGF